MAGLEQRPASKAWRRRPFLFLKSSLSKLLAAAAAASAGTWATQASCQKAALSLLFKLGKKVKERRGLHSRRDGEFDFHPRREEGVGN